MRVRRAHLQPLREPHVQPPALAGAMATVLLSKPLPRAAHRMLTPHPLHRMHRHSGHQQAGQVHGAARRHRDVGRLGAAAGPLAQLHVHALLQVGPAWAMLGWLLCCLEGVVHYSWCDGQAWCWAQHRALDVASAHHLVRQGSTFSVPSRSGPVLTGSADTAALAAVAASLADLLVADVAASSTWSVRVA